ncbi:MAG: BON domain-containing protein, partial [Terriglobales bacterium]
MAMMKSQKSSKIVGLMAASLMAASLLISGCSSSEKQGAKTTVAQTADAQLAGEIQARLNSDPLLTANQRSSVGVRVQGGVATLSGWVTTDGELSAALAAAQGVEGVKQVVSRLQVGQEFAGMPGAAAAYENSSAYDDARANQEALENARAARGVVARKPSAGQTSQRQVTRK